MKPVDPVIRPAEAADLPSITACVECAYRPYVPRIGKPPGPMCEDYTAVIRDHQIFIAEFEEQMIAVLVLKSGPSGLLLDNLAVFPAYQGQGFGRKLIEFAESVAEQQGYSQLDLYTHERMFENNIYTSRLHGKRVSADLHEKAPGLRCPGGLRETEQSFLNNGQVKLSNQSRVS